MNKLSKLTACLAMGTAMFFFSCDNDDDNGNGGGPETEFPGGITATEVTIGNQTYTQLAGEVNGELTLGADTRWLISGGLFVRSGNTLKIEAGTTVYAADDATTPFIAIDRGASIDAQGTAAAPIILTTIRTVTGGAAPGAWGGLIVNGNAPINVPGGTAEGEGGTGPYGGTNAADNSGTIRYVRLEYAGKILGTDNELNGFSFNGVGSATTIEYIQAYKGSDDGIEFFGGTANVKYALSTGNLDDSFDWTFGYSGKGQFLVVEQDPANDGDCGIEADNNDDNNALTPVSNPAWYNLTLIGAGTANRGMRLREGTNAQIFNAIVTGFTSNGVVVEDNSAANVAAGTLVVKNSRVFGNAPDQFAAPNASPFALDATNSTEAVPLTNGYVGVATTGASTPPADSFFTGGNFIGAVESDANDWTKGWTLKLDGTPR